MKFLVPNYSCLQNPWLGGLPPPDPHCLCPLSSTEFVEPPTLPNKIPGYATGWQKQSVSRFLMRSQNNVQQSKSVPMKPRRNIFLRCAENVPLCDKFKCSVIQRRFVRLFKLPYIFEYNPHPFNSFRGLKNQMRIRFAVESWILEK